MAELAGGRVAKGVLDIYPIKFASRKITARVDMINRILGLHLTGEAIRRIFQNLEFIVETVEPGIFEVGVPSFRVDIEREIDLVEEIARLNGFENIPVPCRRRGFFPTSPPGINVWKSA